MKKAIIVTLFITATLITTARAQSKIIKYCKVSVSNKVKISLGESVTSALKDTTVLEKLRYVTQLKSDVDVLDYMKKTGWTLVNIHAAGLYTATEVMYFKKEFDN